MWRVALILLATLSLCAAQSITLVTWNLEWFPGRKPTSTTADRTIHMSAAKDALLEINPDIFCAQEVRDWSSFAELISVIPKLNPLVVSNFRDSPIGGAVSIQQTGIASVYPGDSSWAEPFRVADDTPPRGFSFACIPVGSTMLLVYSVHLKSNRGGVAESIRKREEAARQLIVHARQMETLYAARGPVVIVIAGDFNTDPTDPQFSGETTFQIFFDAGFRWAWQGVPKQDRVTLPSKGQYPDATFDGFLVKGDAELSCKIIPERSVSDHNPVMLQIRLPYTGRAE